MTTTKPSIRVNACSTPTRRLFRPTSVYRCLVLQTSQTSNGDVYVGWPRATACNSVRQMSTAITRCWIHRRRIRQSNTVGRLEKSSLVLSCRHQSERHWVLFWDRTDIRTVEWIIDDIQLTWTMTRRRVTEWKVRSRQVDRLVVRLHRLRNPVANVHNTIHWNHIVIAYI